MTAATERRPPARAWHWPGAGDHTTAEMAGDIGAFADVPADILLMGGTMKRPAFIKPAFEALARTLPHCRRAEFPGLGHGGSSDVGPANRGGKPEIVAPQIRSFFAQQ